MAGFRRLSREERPKAPRFNVQLEVVLLHATERERCDTSIVGVHDIVVRTEHPSEPNGLVSVRIPQGMDDPIEWMGRVSGVTRLSDSTWDMALEIYAIDNKQFARWQWLVARLTERAEPAGALPAAEPPAPEHAPRTPARPDSVASRPVEVRVPTLAALVQLAAGQVARGTVAVRRLRGMRAGDPVANASKDATLLALDGLDQLTRVSLQSFVLNRA